MNARWHCCLSVCQDKKNTWCLAQIVTNEKICKYLRFLAFFSLSMASDFSYSSYLLIWQAMLFIQSVYIRGLQVSVLSRHTTCIYCLLYTTDDCTQQLQQASSIPYRWIILICIICIASIFFFSLTVSPMWPVVHSSSPEARPITCWMYRFP